MIPTPCPECSTRPPGRTGTFTATVNGITHYDRECLAATTNDPNWLPPELLAELQEADRRRR